ncbi:helix-turn-helix domain-containing protein [Vibrio ulleungensis]|jgi:DNA-binding Xre family transcriptional regulator|uniref:Helix-turn-helix domain-containing protein n=1 Tax=Vibrio ulleungensis TaxID=2807619 RepID=A0ABS2HFL1_9VIBR|nr:helix-turn-helix transcriptional regulator [Vibrio ulleungensis]MBM7034862.1 helix-turn-helix domain-containing protein [Vibrio ulleungensis]
METPPLNTLGRNLQKWRVAKGLSLSKLAENAGIAKSNLSRLEQGGGNPTIDTIWRLAVQLDVPFGSLVASMNTPIGDDKVQVRLIEQGTDNPQVDAYWMLCAPHTERLSEPHIVGSIEAVTVISGGVKAGVVGEELWLTAGGTASFCADQPHRYCTEELWTTLLVTITYGKKE